MVITGREAQECIEVDVTKLVLLELAGFVSPAKSEIMEDLGLSVAAGIDILGARDALKTQRFRTLIVMGMSKTEVNLKRLLAAAPQQKNQAKLVHYVATLREQLEQLAEERTSEGLPRVSKAVVNDYSEKIEAIASKLAAPLTTLDTQVSQEPLEEAAVNESPSKTGENHILPTPRLRRRFVPASNSEDRIHDTTGADSSAPVKLDAAAQVHIEKHRKLQEDLTDEMVGLARQLKESSLMMSNSLQSTEKVRTHIFIKLQEDLTDEMVGLARQLKESSLMMSNSLQSTEKILDSTEQAVEHSLASTGHANVRATKIYSESSKTSCFTWLAIFAMTCIFIMMDILLHKKLINKEDIQQRSRHAFGCIWTFYLWISAYKVYL
nr:hypothetical protein CFP56_34245 [Quercus suber]